MKEKLLALLTAKFSGVRRDGLTHLAGSLALQVATEEEAQALVDKLDQAKVTDFVKEWRSGVDTEITTASKTAEDKLKEKYDFVEKKAGGNQGKTDPPADDLDAKFNAYFDSKVKPIQDELNAYKAKESQAARQATIIGKAKELGIPEWRINEGFIIADDADEASINTTLSGVKQNIVTAGLETSKGFPIDQNKTPSKEELDGILGNIL